MIELSELENVMRLIRGGNCEEDHQGYLEEGEFVSAFASVFGFGFGSCLGEGGYPDIEGEAFEELMAVTSDATKMRSECTWKGRGNGVLYSDPDVTTRVNPMTREWVIIPT